MKITLVDYIGYTSAEGKPIGHDLKVLNETIRLLEGFELEIMAAPSYAGMVSGIKTKILPGNVIVSGKRDNIFRNIKRALLAFRNIHFAFKNYEGDYLWFYNVDQFFFLYCFLMKVSLDKVIITAFVAEYPKKYHNYCLLKCLHKIKLAVLTNRECKFHGTNIVYVPDYLYYPDIYDKYKCNNREEKVICVGIMNPSKKIKELVQSFQSIDYPLEIYGYFSDKRYLKEVEAFKRSHIEIVDEYLEYEEMLRLIGSVKYVIFPYDMTVYASATSGILLECVFLEAIPIAPDELLKKSGFTGIRIEEITAEALTAVHVDKNECNASQVNSFYNAEGYRACIRERLLQEERV